MTRRSAMKDPPNKHQHDKHPHAKHPQDPGASGPACRLAATLLALLVGLAPLGARATCADLSLVLAIDASASIDADEFALQQRGYAAALTDPAVLRAMADAGEVELAALYWADAAMPKQIVPWQRIQTPGDAAVFAARLLATPRRITGDTAIGAGLDAALDLLDLPHRCTARALVNLSGDGRASISLPGHRSIALKTARDRATALGVTVNALAILNDEPDLDRYYRDALVTGPGAFVMAVADFSTFGAAIRRKLIREIAPLATAATDPSVGSADRLASPGTSPDGT